MRELHRTTYYDLAGFGFDSRSDVQYCKFQLSGAYPGSFVLHGPLLDVFKAFNDDLGIDFKKFLAGKQL